MKRTYLMLVGLLLISLTSQAQNDTWAVVMTENPNSYQTYKSIDDFPKEYLNQKIEKGIYITDLTYGEGEWVVTLASTKYTGQIFKKSKSFPATWLEEQWKNGYDITEVAFGVDEWVVVMSKNAGLSSESWAKRSSFEAMREFIKAKWNDQKDIVNLACGDGEWVVTLAKGTEYNHQTYKWGSVFPQEWVNERYAKGYHITSLTYGESFWVVVMSRYSKSFGEKYICAEKFPSDWVQKQWDAGKRIKLIHYNYEHDIKVTFDDYFSEGVAATSEKKYDLAIYYYSQAININPKSSVAYNNRAWVKYLNGQCHGALGDVNQSIQLEGDEYNYHTRGAIYLCLDRCREALSDFNASINVASKEQAPYFADRAKAHNCLGHTENALADYEKAISLSPDNNSYKLEKAKIIENQQKKSPPTITWDYPYNSFVSSIEGSCQIKACIHSEEAIKGINLLINNTSFTSRGFGVEDDCTESINQRIQLKEGTNTIVIEIETSAGKFRSKSRTIEYKSHGSGNYHALLIGVQDYDDIAISDLNKPIADTKKMQTVLTSKYTFAPSDVHLLENPSKDDIINKLIYLQERLTDKDNLLVFYSGHGVVKNDIGYWLPRDAQKNQRSKWFSNAELKDYVNSIKTKHTLVIADACFSGSIFTGGYRDITEFACDEMEKIPSRRAMTSGANTVVPDNSIFFKYLIKKLEENDTGCLSAETLYSKVKPAVIYNSPNNHIPQFGVLPQAGDEGGNFIFRTK